MMLDFYDSDYGQDFEACWDWPEGWPQNIEFPDGSMEYTDGDVWFKAYDTSLLEADEDIALFEQGYLFNCYVRLRYNPPSPYCDDVLAHFPAHDKEEAERLLQLAADALYGKSATFDSHGADSALKCRDGQHVTAWPLEGCKYDRCETGPMYYVVFDDGCDANAFADELEWEEA